MRLQALVLILVAVIFAGCSGSGGGVAPGLVPDTATTPRKTADAGSSHHNWGQWQFSADPDAGALEILPLRTGSFHANVVPLLEPPAGVRLKISNLKFDGAVCDVDVSLTHPFPGLSQYTGFDVCGVLISSGTKSGFSDGDLIMAGEGDTRLLNADGYTRWWNPVEFAIPGQPILRYKDGLLGNKNSTAHFTSTLNGYKVFGDDIEPADDVLGLDPTNRVPFSDGVTNTRHYTIDFASGVVFNYAVDANWEPPIGSPPYELDDFVPAANRPEAWAISVTELENTLWSDVLGSGGNLSLLIDVWDHYNAGLNEVWLDSPGNFEYATASPVGGGDGYSTYQVDIVDATPQTDPVEILVGIESEVIGYWDVLLDEPITGYFIYCAQVGGVQPLAPTAILEATTSTDISVGGSVSFDASASTGTPPLSFAWDFNGDDVYGGAEDAYTGDPTTPTHQFDSVGSFSVTVKVSNAVGEDISDAVIVHVGLDPNDTYVDGDYTGTDSNGSPAKPFKTIQEGMSAVTTGHKVHVDYLDGGTHVYDTAALTLKSDVQLLGDNWNGGGPGKPKMKNTSGYYTIGSYGSIINNFTLEGFEIGIGEQAGSTQNYGIYFVSYSGAFDDITIRHNKITGTIDDTGKTSGPGMALQMRRCDNSTVEFNDCGPLTWESDTSGVYARVLWGMYLDTCNNIEVNNNFIHDFTIDYDGAGGGWGQIRVFCLHFYASNNADIYNNLICHIEGINDYDYRIEGTMFEGSSGTNVYDFHNNTIDRLDHSQSNGNFPLRGIFVYAATSGSEIDNTLITHFYTPAGQTGSIQAYFSSPANIFEASYSTGHDLGSVTSYFYNFILGDGVTNYPGIDPKYVNNTTSPYDYHFQSGSGCEMGDPDFIDWDDSGSPSGNPNETNIQNRSRMGCFGGPGGDWDPYDL